MCFVAAFRARVTLNNLGRYATLIFWVEFVDV